MCIVQQKGVIVFGRFDGDTKSAYVGRSRSEILKLDCGPYVLACPKISRLGIAGRNAKPSGRAHMLSLWGNQEFLACRQTQRGDTVASRHRGRCISLIAFDKTKLALH